MTGYLFLFLPRVLRSPFSLVFLFISLPSAYLQEVTQGTQRTTRNTKIFIYDRISIAISSSRSSKSIFPCVPLRKSAFGRLAGSNTRNTKDHKEHKDFYL